MPVETGIPTLTYTPTTHHRATPQTASSVPNNAQHNRTTHGKRRLGRKVNRIPWIDSCTSQKLDHH
jgi:hypothetical protein